MIAYYLKVKVLELLMFLNQVSLQDYQEERRYFARNQVQTIKKKMQEYMTADLRNHYTLQELSEKFEIPLTSMKVCFKGVYGCSIYAYMKSYRMQAATILLRDTSDSITEIAAKMGYDNPSKFSEVFKKEFGELPSEFRKSCPNRECLVFLEWRQNTRYNILSSVLADDLRASCRRSFF